MQVLAKRPALLQALLTKLHTTLQRRHAFTTTFTLCKTKASSAPFHSESEIKSNIEDFTKGATGSIVDGRQVSKKAKGEGD